MYLNYNILKTYMNHYSTQAKAAVEQNTTEKKKNLTLAMNIISIHVYVICIGKLLTPIEADLEPKVKEGGLMGDSSRNF